MMTDKQYETMVDEVTELLRALGADVADDYRATNDPNDNTAAMQVTIATTHGDSWGYQTGDNRYTGACYGEQYWGVGSVARDDDDDACREEAERMVEEIAEQMAQYETEA